eukprot:CAMPEP_0170609546 /NCGR_PEP_ID=MMETSP0224-20130122/22184_1 /TAXON_ID=285029 /ORGANISM="Togula jolla, Strain CCCM 725" /LENGTH=442 /DNA_ID=CAMNT_0010934863 /DNA_START=6 /DNA_END=1334 /DNA_ORIENTATION=+
MSQATAAASDAAAPASGASSSSAAVSLPPGLEADARDANGLRSQEGALAAIRDLAMRDVDRRVTEKVEEMWLRGKQLVSSAQKGTTERIDTLTEELARCKERIATLEEQNQTLKQIVNSLEQKFCLLGSVFAGGASVKASELESHAFASASADVGAGVASGGGSSAASTATPRTLGSPAEFRSPASLVQGGSAALPPSLPEVPPFPFPQDAAATTASTMTRPSQTATDVQSKENQNPAALLSIFEALGIPEKKQGSGLPPTPVCLANSLKHVVPSYPAAGATPVGGVSSFTFSFTLRKAANTTLGLNVSHSEGKEFLHVDGIRPDGAIEAWNRQCAGTLAAEKMVHPGDSLISVNGIMRDSTKMLEECRDRQLLKLMVVRGEVPVEERVRDATTPTPARSTRPAMVSPLRAEAQAFVPTLPERSAEVYEDASAEAVDGAKAK